MSETPVIETFPTVDAWAEAIAARLMEGGQVAKASTRLPSASDDLGLPEAAYDAVFSVLDLQGFNDEIGRAHV